MNYDYDKIIKSYKVSIIIASFNNFMLLKSCLNSLEDCTQGINYEVIIVDNNSDEETVNYLRSIKRTNYTIIYNKENLGFAKANNQGIKIAGGEYLVLLNNDKSFNVFKMAETYLSNAGRYDSYLVLFSFIDL